MRQTSGSGLPVLFLQGLSGSKAVFARQFGSWLGAEYRMLAFDWPGCGRNSQAFAPERTASIEGYADLAVEVLELLGLEEVVVVGWEIGGLVGLELATILPGLVGTMAVRLPRGQRAWDGATSLLAAGVIPNADAFADQGRVPLVLVDGEVDPALTLFDPAGSPTVWGASQHIVPGAAGAPFRERPAAFNELLAGFLGQMAERYRRMRARPPLTHGA